ncbi:hypothetical protein HAX54_002413 [Datura stramonium]|uniref:Uncharacterized protein n=1 Tax=Datura stramonium TaxID=4076 RepID=A0ABS8T4M1_DATST|nr:hypothetical protein [Datura stramonium]
MKKLYRKGTVHPSPPLISDHLSFLPVAILTLAAALSQEDKEVLAYLISCSSGEFSGNRRTTQKSTTTNPAPATSTGGGGGGSGDQLLSGNFSGNRRNTHQKSTTPNSASESSGGGSKGIASANGGGAEHVPSFNCYCFSCYMSYWVKWDSSPNRQLIHEILDAYEDGLQNKKAKSKKERRNKNGSSLKKNGSSNGDVGSSGELKKSSSESSLNKNGSGSTELDPVEETSGGGGGDEEETGGGDEGTEKGSVRKFVSFLGERIWSVWT